MNYLLTLVQKLKKRTQSADDAIYLFGPKNSDKSTTSACSPRTYVCCLSLFRLACQFVLKEVFFFPDKLIKLVCLLNS